MTATDGEVIEIIGGRNVYGYGTLFGVRRGAGGNRDPAADGRKNDIPADEAAIALVIGMHRHGGVVEHGLRTRRGNGNATSRIISQRIIEVPELALGLNLL